MAPADRYAAKFDQERDPGGHAALGFRQEAHVPEEKADLLHAIYERIVVAGPEIVRARLTSAA